MSNLEDLVPPLNLCRKIPFPKFEDSVFVWERKNGWILERTNMDCDLEEEGYYIPAPTLQEILAELTPGEDGCGELTQFGKDKHSWFMMASFEGNDDGYGSGFETYEEKDRNNPAAAALRLWLEVNERNGAYGADEANKTIRRD